MKITKTKLKKLIVEEIENDPALLAAIQKLTGHINKLDVSIDYLAAIFGERSPLELGIGQSQFGRFMAPKSKLRGSAPVVQKENRKMKITKTQLKQIIKEELKHVLKEGFDKHGVQILQELLSATQVMTKLVGAGDESAAMQQYERWAEQNMNSVKSSGAGRSAPNLLTPSNAKEFYYAIDTQLRRHYRTAEKDFKDAADLYQRAKDRGDSDEQIAGSSGAPPSVRGGDEIIVTLKAKALVDKLEAANKAGLDSLKA